VTGRRRIWVPLAAASAFIAVAVGAFAAHGAEGAARELLRTGAYYQMVHALAVLAWAALRPPAHTRVSWTPALFMAGSALFSGSLYMLAFGAARVFGAVTPIGGLMFLAGWATFAWSAALAGDRPERHSDS
jgi:uncharacterized membrane protein YgdD (TMEM256/DUF423 family)